MAVTINGTTGITGAPLNSGTAVASTSGTSIDFTGIPSWVKRITVSLSNVRKSSTSSPLLQLMISSGAVATGYLGAGTSAGASVASSNYTTGFGIRATSSADVVHGAYVLMLISSVSNTWAATGMFGASSSTVTYISGGSVSLSGVLTGVRFTTTGADTYNQGTINIIYE